MPDPPVNPISNAVPVGLVIFLTALKQVYIRQLDFF